MPELTRREAIAALGGLVATSALPSWGADESSVFAQRGRFERLVLAYQHVHIGLERPFSVLHVSDTHLTSAYPDEPKEKQELRQIRTQTFGGCQEEALRDSLDWAKRNVDYVVHTGDLVDWQSRANFDLVKKYFGGAMLGALGNHEFSPSMWLGEKKPEPTEAFKDLSRAALASVFPFDIELQSMIVRGVNFVALDDVYGTVTARQVARFADEVKKGLPIVLCLHVPIFTPALWRADTKFWSADRKFSEGRKYRPSGDYARQLADAPTRDFIDALRREPLLKAILAGHMHITIQEKFSPTAMQFVVGGNFMFHGEEILFA